MASSGLRVAITGAAGYLARGLIRRLEREDAVERVFALDVRPLHTQSSKIVAFQHNINDPLDGLLAIHRVNSVVHLAYVLNPGHNRAMARQVNVDGTASVLDACAHAGVRHLLYLSSTSVYGAHPDNPDAMTEDQPVRPLKGFQYSEDKAEAEALIQDFTRQHPDLSATVLRVCPVMGRHADNFIASAFSKPVLVAVRGYDPPMQLIHEDDLTDIMWLCLERQAQGTYNVGGDGAIRWSEMAKSFGRRVLTLPAPVLYGMVNLGWSMRLQNDSPPCGVSFIRYPWRVSIEKLRQELGVSLRYTSREAWDSFVQRNRE